MPAPGSISWTAPSPILLILPPLCLWIQSALLFPPPSTRLNLLRLLLTPPSILLILHSFRRGYFKPEPDFIIFNIVIQICRSWSLLKSLEYGVASWGKRKRWIGYRRALASIHHALAGTKKEGDSVAYDEYGDPAYPRTTLETVYYAWAHLTSLRGFGWDDAPAPSTDPSPVSEGNAPHGQSSTMRQTRDVQPSRQTKHSVHSNFNILYNLLVRIGWTHLLLLAGLTFILLCEEAGFPDSVLTEILDKAHLDTGFLREPSGLGFLRDSDSLQCIAHVAVRALYVLCFGVCVYAALECGFSILTLIVYLVHALLETCPPSFRPRRRFDVLAWPKLMSAPYFATSLHSFWGSHWHTLFRPPFVAIGFTPARWLVSSVLGLRHDLGNAAGVFGVFAVSGWMHEAINAATPYKPRDPHYRSFTFFFLQGIGIILESVFTKVITKNRYRVGGWLGLLWTFTWLLWTGRLMADCWMERGLAAFMPPLQTWEWWRFIVPYAFIFPRLAK